MGSFRVMLSATLCAAGVAFSETAEGLVGFWAFNGCDGKTVRDASPLGNDGLIEGARLRAEKSGASLELDGLGAHVVIRERVPFGLTNTLTATLWVHPTALRRQTPLFGIPHATDNWTTPMFGMYIADERVVFGLWPSPGTSKPLVESPDPLPLDTWTFLAGTFDGASARLFVNGRQVASLPHTGTIVSNGLPLLIGKGIGSAKPSLRGRVGELRLFNRALPPEEVAALFTQTRPAYDLAAPPPPRFKDGTVTVETHGKSPEDSRPWRARPTRLLALLDGYRPAAQPVALTRFGGWADHPAAAPTGFFRVKRSADRNWLIDPEGCLFYKVGINAVHQPRRGDASRLPQAQWAEQTVARLRDAGFNGLGNWSSTSLRETPAPLVWVLRKNFMFDFAKEKRMTVPASGTTGFIDKCMPVFHPDFEPFCEKAGPDLEATANDPFLLGIMTDNELQCPADLLDRHLALDAANPDLKHGRDAARVWLAARKGSADPAGITQRDRYEFIAFAFERYYRIVTRVIKRHDPNHLYLGSRINYGTGQFDNPYFWKVLAATHDVVSVNFYTEWGPQARQCAEWRDWSGGVPLLFTEWYAKALDVPGLANTHGAGWLVRTQEDRAGYYQHFALNALEIPTVVGWHFFKYLDDPAESKALDSAGGANKGMFDLEGNPHQPLLDHARAVNREVYPLTEFFDRRRMRP